MFDNLNNNRIVLIFMIMILKMFNLPPWKHLRRTVTLNTMYRKNRQKLG